MATRESPRRRGTERGRSLLRYLCAEAEAARAERGTSYAELGRAMRLGGGQVAQICRGQSPDLSIVRAAQLLAVLGLDLSLRAYPSGPRLRDVGQVRLLERLRVRLAPELRWRIEVPVIEVPEAGSTDRRSWDAAIDGAARRVRVEAETRVGDLQAVQRRIALKQRDGRIDVVLLLLADTRHHRAMLRLAGDGLLAQFPGRARPGLQALAAGRLPEANTLIRL